MNINIAYRDKKVAARLHGCHFVLAYLCEASGLRGTISLYEFAAQPKENDGSNNACSDVANNSAP